MSPSLTEVALAMFTTPLTSPSPLEVLQGGSLQDVVGRLGRGRGKNVLHTEVHTK
jgi:hypothetical protein